MNSICFGLAFGTVPDRPAFVAYAERCRARPAHRRMTAANDAFRVELAADTDA